MQNTQTLYDQQATRWERRAPNSLSDFTGRPRIFDLCGDVKGLDLIDLGSGEGYGSREMKSRGAKRVVGIELSEKMTALAKKQEAAHPLGIEYLQGDVTSVPFKNGEFDVALAIFVFNYLSLEQSLKTFREIYRVLKPGGRAICSFPHPCFPFMRSPRPPFFFDLGKKGYYSGRDTLNEGKISCRDGQVLDVRVHHKTFEDLFFMMRESGFKKMPEVLELGVLKEHLELDSTFFNDIKDVPLHLAIRLER